MQRNKVVISGPIFYNLFDTLGTQKYWLLLKGGCCSEVTYVIEKLKIGLQNIDRCRRAGYCWIGLLDCSIWIAIQFGGLDCD
jgi:hypothetical protein